MWVNESINVPNSPKKKLEVQTEVETALDWGAALREVAASGGIIKCEGVVTGVGEVASPDVEGEETEVGCDVSTKEGVCLLAEGVGLVPIGLAG